MKYKSKIYAEALVGLMDSKKAGGSKIIDNFIELLKKNGDMKKAKEIISLAEAIFLKKTGKRKVTVETARKIGRNLSALLSKELQADAIEEKINPEIIAGIKIIVNNEKQLDFSLKGKLEKIFS